LGLRNRTWRRFLRGPDPALLEELYVPALSNAVRYDRSCAYFSSSVLAAAARGFGPLIERLLDLGADAPRPAVRLVVNEQLSRQDVEALLNAGSTTPLERVLLERLRDPVDALERDRLGMLAFLVREGLLAVRVGVMRHSEGIVHAKYGIVYDAEGDAIVFMGSGNESASGLRGNYEKLEVSTSWDDRERYEHYRDEFERLWKDEDADVATVPLPEAVRLKLVKYATEAPEGGWPVVERRADERRRRENAMRWQFVVEAPYLERGDGICDATAMVDLWPHQRRVVEDASRAWPEGRLLCDEVGMGKTIEAILVLRRLLAGRGVRRALLLLPAGLLKQWQAELREKGGLVVPRFESQSLIWPDGTQERVGGLAEALESDLLILSRETARLEQNADLLLGGPAWDVVLLDEAHAARRARQEEREFNSATLLLQLLRRLQLESKARGFLLLSATPMQTHPWEPWDLLSVLGEGAPWLSDFGYVRAYYAAVPAIAAGPTSPQLAREVERIILQDDAFPPAPAKTDHLAQRLAFAPRDERTRLAEWLRSGAPLGRRMHRNTRDTLRVYYEQGIISKPPPRRLVVDCRFDYRDAAERAVYESIATYVSRRFEELEREKPGKGFVMTVYRRRAASSPYALRRSLERRRDGLKRVIHALAADTLLDPRAEGLDTLDLDDLPEADETGRISSALPTDPHVAQGELRDVQRILDGLANLGPTDTKLEYLLDALHTATDDGRPVLVFSEYTDTVDYLREALFPKYGAAIGCYTGDGGLFWDGHQWKGVGKDVITARLRDGELRILLCTDAASEGLNLQAAGAVINYDLPWNPSRVEQRIGRVDRIGQEAAEVRIINLFLVDSVDDRVYQVLRARCGMFDHFVGAMQPVLAAARTMLLGKDRFDRSILENVAAQVERDHAARAAFAPSTDPPDTRPPAGMVREQAMQALLMVDPSGEMSVDGQARRITISDEDLASDPSAWPLCPFDQRFRRLLDELDRPGELLPLVVGAHEDGAFRASVAYWCHPDHREEVERFDRLEALLGMWDGRFVSPADWIAAEKEAQRAARERVEAMKREAARRERRGLERQIEAARLRLLRELARYLLCVDPDAADLNQVFHAQRTRDIASAVRLGRAYELVGYPEWDTALVEEIRQLVRGLGANQRDNVLLGSPLDAAIGDPRWRARETVARAAEG